MSSKKKEEPESGRYAYEGLDRVLHEKARLGILTSLSTHPEGLLFNQLKNLCSLSDGNLSRHIQVLEEAGLVEVWKGFHRRRPQTLCRITPAGLKRFQTYLQELEKVVRDAAAARDAAVQAKKTALADDKAWAEGWVPA
jgi:DNA-binding MarR family transcriptional regulator